MAKAGRGADQYMLRFPEGLRDRIKAYAERRGTSMNSEIIRVLEREFPEQWPFEERLQHLSEAISIIGAGKDDPRIEGLLQAFKDTVEGIVSGRVTGVDTETRDAVEIMWLRYRERESEDELESYRSDYDEEELRTLDTIGRPEKYAIPPESAVLAQQYSPEELDAYLRGLKDGRQANRKPPFPDDE